MKIHLFYTREPIPRIYAFTKVKSLANKFVSQRDMTNFTHVVKKVTEDEYSEYTNYYMSLELLDYFIYSKNSDLYKQDKYPFVMSFKETGEILKLEERMVSLLWEKSRQFERFLNIVDRKTLNIILPIFRLKGCGCDQLRIVIDNHQMIV